MVVHRIMPADSIVPTRREGQSAESTIQTWVDTCNRNEIPLEKIKPRLVRAACACARSVLFKTQSNHRGVCLAAVEAAESWIENPREENRLKACNAGCAAICAATLGGGGALWSAGCAASVAAQTSIEDAVDAAFKAAAWAYTTDPSVNFPAKIAMEMAEYDLSKV